MSDYTIRRTDQVRDYVVADCERTHNMFDDCDCGTGFDRWNAPREEALDAIQRVRELHRERKVNGSFSVCTCQMSSNTQWYPGSKYPCSTVEALEGNHE